MQNIYRFMLVLMLSIAIGSTQAQDTPLKIVASHSILGDVVANVVGDSAEVTVTMPAGTDPHSFEASPSDLTALADADVIFVNGAFFEEGLLEAIENAGMDMNIVEASRCVQIIPVGASHQHEDEAEHAHEDEHLAETDALCDGHIAEFDSYHEQGHEDEDDHDHAHEDEHEHEEHEFEILGRLYAIDCGEGDAHHDEDEHEHEAGSCDPHVWMEPHNVMYWTMLIRDTLIELDPTNADVYTANADAYLTQLDELIHDVIIPLVDTLPEENRVLITSHDSLGYLAVAHHFELVGTIIPGGSTVAEPSVQDIAQLIDLIQARGVPAIFGETTVNDTITQAIAAETDAELFVLYSGSLSDSSGEASTYLDYIRYNYTTIVTALGGG